jgi:hypothetical protein
LVDRPSKARRCGRRVEGVVLGQPVDLTGIHEHALIDERLPQVPQIGMDRARLILHRLRARAHYEALGAIHAACLDAFGLQDQLLRLSNVSLGLLEEVDAHNRQTEQQVGKKTLCIGCIGFR